MKKTIIALMALLGVTAVATEADYTLTKEDGATWSDLRLRLREPV